MDEASQSEGSTALSESGSPVKSEAAAALCPYCGSITPTGARCAHCRGLLDPLSRQATTNTMGPWFIRDESQPFRPGCSYQTLVSLVQRGKVLRTTIMRGPSTRQFWTFAGKTPGVAHLLGVCHSCQEVASSEDFACNNCGAVFTAEEDRQRLGIGPLMEVPGQSLPEPKSQAKNAGASLKPREAPSPSNPPLGPAPWDSQPRRSSGMLVGGVLLACAALAAAAYAVRSWVNADQSAVPAQPHVAPATSDPPAAQIPSATEPKAATIPTEHNAAHSAPAAVDQPPASTTPNPDPNTKPQPASSPEVEARRAAPDVSWSDAWRAARGLP